MNRLLEAFSLSFGVSVPIKTKKNLECIAVNNNPQHFCDSSNRRSFDSSNVATQQDQSVIRCLLATFISSEAFRREIRRSRKSSPSPANVVVLAGPGASDWPPIDPAAGPRCPNRAEMEFSPGRFAVMIAREQPESGLTEAEAVSGAGAQRSPRGSEDPHQKILQLCWTRGKN